MLTPVVKRTTADAVFDQLADQIVAGDRPAGSVLPSERTLAAELEVSRPAVREALQRLAQAGLLAINQGEATRVRAVEDAASLDLLPRLIGRGGRIDPLVMRSVLELRASVGEDAARWCAVRATEDQRERLAATVTAMAEAGDDLRSLQALDLTFWHAVVAGADNIAYRLAFNGLVAAYVPALEVLGEVLRAEVSDLAGHRRLVTAVDRHDPEAARRAARHLLGRSDEAWRAVLAEAER